MKTPEGIHLSRLISGVLAAALAPPAMAQAGHEMEEVLVTARKRDESYQEVPVTINVFTETAISDAGIEKPGDFIAMVPNMTLVETQNAGNAFVVVRGISQARNSEPSVAVIVDGVLETNPADFNKELFDIRQIEVLKGPQGALYGRNAIGGAVIIRTKDPGDEFGGSVKAGLGNGDAVRLQGSVTGPITDSLSYRASVNYYDTDGYLDNEFLGTKADPVKDESGRLRFVWKPNDAFTGDLRFAFDDLHTKALYFVIPRDVEANPFSTFFTPPNANDTSSPIQLDNPGTNLRHLWNASLKMDFALGAATLTSVTAYNSTEELLTGDAFDFRPAPNSIFMALFGVDLNQSQYLNVDNWSQELRLTSPDEGRFRWIAGAYFVHTDRFISTGNMIDDGTGVHAVYHRPRLAGNNPSFTFLADSQDNDAWAVFANATFELSDQFELDTAVRYDKDKRRNTTETPTAFLPDPSAFTGEVRKHSWSETQPKITLRWRPSDTMTVYGGWSRGFRSGGFNQTGVGAVADASGIAGVNDLFNAEVADTAEIGLKAQFMDNRVNLGLSAYSTESENSYFFVFLAANSTQNLGNLDADYEGAEIEINARVTDNFDIYASYGITDSKITDMEDPTVEGNEAPLVSENTANLGFQFRQPIGNLEATFRADYHHIGRTWWEPYNTTSRDPVDLVDARVSLGNDTWDITAWSKNLTDKKYNQEFSPGGFLFRALPRRYGVEFSYKF